MKYFLAVLKKCEKCGEDYPPSICSSDCPHEQFNGMKAKSEMTDEEFWKLCELAQNDFGNWGVWTGKGDGKHLDIITGSKEHPSTDLNNLEKYAFPLLDKWYVARPFKTSNHCVANVWRGEKYGFGEGNDPAQALKEALGKVLKEKR